MQTEYRLVNWALVYTPRTVRDAQKLKAAGLQAETQALLRQLTLDPSIGGRAVPLVGDLAGACACRISFQHQLIYQVLQARRTVKVIRLWTLAE